MNRFLGKLTGWQITAIICAAILAPSGLYAAATFSNVALVNPVTGTPALIDGAGSLHNVDILAQFANNPLYKVTIEFPLVVPTGCQSAAYAIPAGKALVITAISGNYYEVDAGVPVSGLAFYASANCTGNNYGKHYTPMTGVAGVTTGVAELIVKAALPNSVSAVMAGCCVAQQRECGDGVMLRCPTA